MIKLPIDIKSLYFNIKNDNMKGHTPTVATPLRKTEGKFSLENILFLKDREIDINSNVEILELLVKHSKSKVKIKKVYVFNKLAVNGLLIDTPFSFSCYIKEEIDETKVQYGRLKLHYPSKLIFQSGKLNINNKEIYKSISSKLNDYAFIIRAFEYDVETEILNFDALIVGENNIPYSKVFINEKGTGNKFNVISNNVFEDYDREIINFRKCYGEIVNTSNFDYYVNKERVKALNLLQTSLNIQIENVSSYFNFSLFDFIYEEKGVRKYGILRITSTNIVYFNLSIHQQLFLADYQNYADIFYLSNCLNNPKLIQINYDDLSKYSLTINSIMYEKESSDE